MTHYHNFSEILKCIEFIEGWYSYRNFTKKEVVDDFKIERITITSYLSSRFSRVNIDVATDIFQITMQKAIKD